MECWNLEFQNSITPSLQFFIRYCPLSRKNIDCACETITAILSGRFVPDVNSLHASRFRENSSLHCEGVVARVVMMYEPGKNEGACRFMTSSVPGLRDPKRKNIVGDGVTSTARLAGSLLPLASGFQVLKSSEASNVQAGGVLLATIENAFGNPPA